MNSNNIQFNAWLAGVMDGDGNFDFRATGLGLKAIRIKLHQRDKPVLNHIKHILGCGRINPVKNTSYVLYIVSTHHAMTKFVRAINGHIRVKAADFKKALRILNVAYEAAPAKVPQNSAYFSGLVDSDGSVVFNYPGNRIEVSVQLNRSPDVDIIDFSSLIAGTKPNRILRTTASGKEAYVFKFQSVRGMIHVNRYLQTCALQSPFKKHRAEQIARFLDLRHFKNSPYGSESLKAYSRFLIDFISCKNPGWRKKVLWLEKLDKDIVHKYKAFEL
jgi:LAGLIDADG endonuclease